MPSHPFYTNFTAGEVTDKLSARHDYDRYSNAASCIKNGVVQPQGGVARRAGSAYVAAAKFPDARCRLVKFEFSVDEAYVLEFGNFYIRFFKDRAPVTSGGVPVEVVSPYSTADLRELRFEQSADVMYIGHPNSLPRKLSRVTDTSFRLDTIVFDPPPTAEKDEFFSSNLTLSAVTGTFVTVTASSSTFVGADRGRHIRSDGGGRGAIVNVASGTVLQIDVLETFESQNIAAGDWWMTGSPNGSAVNITDNARPAGTPATIQSSTDNFRPTDLGKYVHLHGGVLRITNVQSNTVVSGWLVKALNEGVTTAATAVGAWTLESPVWSTDLGYPGVPCLHAGRLYWAGSATYPDTIYGSEAGDYEAHGRGPEDDDALVFTLGSPGVNIVRWMKSTSSGLAIGTVASEGTLAGGTDTPLSPSAAIYKERTHLGSDYNVDAQHVDNQTLFLQAGATRLREFAYNLEADTFLAGDISIIAEHLFREQIVEMAYARAPESFVFALRDDGVLNVCTFERGEKVIAWTHAETDGEYESVVTIPNACGTGMEVWVAVKRQIQQGGMWADTIWGSTIWGTGVWAEDAPVVDRRYIEVFDGVLSTDSALIASSDTAFTSVTGFGHLVGKTVKAILGDGTVYDIVVDSTGVVTLPTGVSTTSIEVGLGFTTTIQTVRPELSTRAGTVQGRLKHWNWAVLRLFCTEGTPLFMGEEIQYPDDHDDAEPFTGDTKRNMQIGWDHAGKLTVQFADPVPATLLGIVGSLEAEDD